MISGDPYETEALDLLRAEQRRLLAVLRKAPPLAQILTDETFDLPMGNPPLQETTCRVLAAELLAPNREYLEAQERAQMIETLRQILDHVGGPGWAGPIMGQFPQEERYIDWDSDRDRQLSYAAFLMIAADTYSGVSED